MRTILLSLVSLATVAICQAQTASVPAATETFDYLVITDVAELNSQVKDPTRGCVESRRLYVLGNLGWELTHIFEDARKDGVVAQGAIVLEKALPSGTQRGRIAIETTSKASLRVIFKRRSPHVMQTVKSCQ